MYPSLVHALIKNSKHETFEKDKGDLGFLMISELILSKYCLIGVIENLQFLFIYIHAYKKVQQMVYLTI